MSATIERFVLVDRHDTEQDHEFDTLEEARAANDGKHAIIARQYEYADSELVETPNGADSWPPKARATRTK